MSYIPILHHISVKKLTRLNSITLDKTVLGDKPAKAELYVRWMEKW